MLHLQLERPLLRGTAATFCLGETMQAFLGLARFFRRRLRAVKCAAVVIIARFSQVIHKSALCPIFFDGTPCDFRLNSRQLGEFSMKYFNPCTIAPSHRIALSAFMIAPSAGIQPQGAF
jgi:hypothetical protein